MTDQPPDPPQQPPYGQPLPPPPPQYPPAYPQPGYGQQGYGQPFPVEPPSHKSATTALILGILGLVLCPLVLSIPAWVIGRRAVKEIDASQGQLGGRGSAQAGYVLGIVGTVWAGPVTLLVIVVFAAGGIIKDTFDDTCTNIDDGAYSEIQC